MFDFIEWEFVLVSSLGVLAVAYYVFDSPLSPKWEQGLAKDEEDPRGFYSRYFQYSVFALSASIIIWRLEHGYAPPDDEIAFGGLVGMILLEGLLDTVLRIFSPVSEPKDPKYRAVSRFAYLGLLVAYASVSLPFLI